MFNMFPSFPKHVHTLIMPENGGKILHCIRELENAKNQTTCKIDYVLCLIAAFTSFIITYTTDNSPRSTARPQYQNLFTSFLRCFL